MLRTRGWGVVITTDDWRMWFQDNWAIGWAITCTVFVVIVIALLVFTITKAGQEAADYEKKGKKR